jgi:ketosteroid isomerase-like protein
MKTLKSVVTGIALLFVCFAANAIVKPIADRPTKTDVINMYIDAITHGKADQLNNVLDDDIKFNVKRGDNVTTLNKDQLMASLKQNNVSDTSVTTTTTVVTDDDDASIVKVDFKYADYVRTDVVTLSKTNGWVITKVTSSFK